jgi:NTP pyrophosphatase (non-canonical NTP hydrolase)
MARETQETVSAWCDRHYPGLSAAQRLKDLVEEVTELAASLNNVPLEEILDIVCRTWEKSAGQLGDRRETPGEIGDVRISVMSLATALGIDEQEALDEKMAINRAKSPEESQARFQRKVGIFGPGKG